MVKVKIIENPHVDGEDSDKYVGNIYEAFIDNRFEEGYCVNLLDNIWFIQKKYCEEINECIEQNEEYRCISTPKEKVNYDKILLVEDGSVDVDYIEDELGIKCIIYRQGSNKPQWLGE